MGMGSLLKFKIHYITANFSKIPTLLCVQNVIWLSQTDVQYEI